MLRRIWGILTAFLSAALPLLSFGTVGSAGRNCAASVCCRALSFAHRHHPFPCKTYIPLKPSSVCLKQLGNLHVTLVLFRPQPKVAAAMISCMYVWPVVVNSHAWHTTAGLLGHRNFSSLFCTSILKLQFLNLVENWGWRIAKSPWNQLVCPRCFSICLLQRPPSLRKQLYTSRCRPQWEADASLCPGVCHCLPLPAPKDTCSA